MRHRKMADGSQPSLRGPPSFACFSIFRRKKELGKTANRRTVSVSKMNCKFRMHLGLSCSSLSRGLREAEQFNFRCRVISEVSETVPIYAVALFDIHDRHGRALYNSRAYSIFQDEYHGWPLTAGQCDPFHNPIDAIVSHKSRTRIAVPKGLFSFVSWSIVFEYSLSEQTLVTVVVSGDETGLNSDDAVAVVVSSGF